MTSKTEKCTILVSSCDEYKDIWDSSFKILSREWPDIKYPVVLLTEKESYDCRHMNVNVFAAGQEMVWGKRIRKCLKSIDTEYIILLLDDFYPLKNVQQQRIEQCMSWMDKDKNIAVFTFNFVPGVNIKDGKYPHFEKRPRDGEYRFNCQPAVWRRERLIGFLKPNETPWDWEIIGSIRSTKYDDDFYSAIEGEPYIFTHLFSKYGLRQGKWGVATKELFKKYDISMDFSARGFYDDIKAKETQPEQICIIKKIPRHLKWRLRNMKIRVAKYKAKKYLKNI